MIAQSQLYPNSDNTTAGRLLISGNASSTDYDDITIDRDKAHAGIKVFNHNTAGRSVLLFGHDYGGKYGFLAHHNPSFNAGAGYTQTYKASSTVLVGADISGLGIISSTDIRFNTGGDDDAKIRMVINSTGNVGIGVINPTAKLQTIGSIYSNATRSNTIFTGNIGTDNANFIGSEGYWAFRTATDNSFNLDVYNSNAPVSAITVMQNGNVGIGTLSPDSKLTVKGTIHTNEVRVDINAPIQGPDYVFEKDYDLLALSQLEAYINQYKHLPEVPSAKEMEENGLNLKEMNLLLLKKVEEVTLHLIEQNKKIEDLKKLVEVLESEIKH